MGDVADTAECAEPTAGGALSAFELNSRFVGALAPIATGTGFVDLTKKPVEVPVTSTVPSPVRAYLYTLTSHASERQAGAYRCQVILPGAVRGGSKTHLDTSGGAFVVLGGYEPELDCFCLWDARLYDRDGFAYSRGMQIKDRTIYEAATHGLAEQRRQPRGRGSHLKETVVVAHGDKLAEGLKRRWAPSCERLVGEDQ